MNSKKSYYAIIPADVRYDKELPMGARMLYGELTALSNDKGYCWATNSYFSQLYEVTTATISNWLSKLEERGHIQRKIIYKEGSKEVKERRIYIHPIKENLDTPLKNFGEGHKEILDTPPQKIFKENNTLLNNTFNNTVELINNPILRETLNQLKQIKNYPFDTEKDIEFINSLLIDFPSLDIKEELKKWATYKLDKPLSKTSNARLQFRNWCKNSAKWKAEREQQNKGTSEQPFRRTKSEILLPIEYYEFHGLPVPEEVKKREEEKKAKEQMPSSEKVSEILRKAKKEILNKKGEDNGSS